VKKILFIAMALVVALGGLGIGYARWTDQVTISGNVNTGSLSLQLSQYSGDEVYKDPATGTLVYAHWFVNGTGGIETKQYNKIVPGTYQPPFTGLILVAYASATLNPGFKSITVDYHNLFPIPGVGWYNDGCFFTDFRICNLGTVPVILDVTMTTTGTIGNLPAGSIILEQCGGGAIDGVQLEGGECIGCALLKICIPDDNAYQSLSGTITVTIDGVQWNEAP